MNPNCHLAIPTVPMLARRDFLRSACLGGTTLALASSLRGEPVAQPPIPTNKTDNKRRAQDDDAAKLPGAQRLAVDALQQWEAMNFGMFIHFGMSTFLDSELPGGSEPSTAYAPDKLDVDQWISVARDAGMKYAVLTTKHVAGHCLWPTRHNDYHVGTSGNKTDVVAAFVKACERRGLKPGFYYCAWDNHNRFGSITPNLAPFPGGRHGPPLNRNSAFVTQQYLDFQWAQITELMDNYGPVMEWWLDIPLLLPRDYRNRLYAHIATRQPEALIIYNNGIGDGSEYIPDKSWPTDAITIERFLPNAMTGHVKWRNIDGQNYYLPGEVCDRSAPTKRSSPAIAPCRHSCSGPMARSAIMPIQACSAADSTRRSRYATSPHWATNRGGRALGISKRCGQRK